jgi:hypothetical protein
MELRIVNGKEAKKPDNDRRTGRFSLGERAAAFWALAIAVAAIAGLVISLVSHKSDSRLATIALILASVAFFLQIAFFLVQLWAAREQDRRSSETFRQTEMVLTRIEARSEQTVDVINQQFRFVLEQAFAARSGVIATVSDRDMETDVTADADEPLEESDDAGRGSDGMPELEKSRALAAELDKLIGQQNVLRQWDQIAAPARHAQPRGRKLPAWAKAFLRWPGEEEGKSALDDWDALAPHARDVFRDLAQATREAARVGQAGYPGRELTDATPEVIDELRSRGLISDELRRVTPGDKLRPFLHLTDSGAVLARLLTSTGSVPRWLSESGRAAELAPNGSPGAS